MNKLQTVTQLEEVAQQQGNYVIFKRSTTCPISHAAFDEFEKYATDAKVPLLYLNVQEARELSQEIATRFHVRHESPQVLYIQNNEVAWHASHWNITKQSLQQHIV